MNKKNWVFIVFLLFSAQNVLSHGDEDLAEDKQKLEQNSVDDDGWETINSGPPKELLEKINISYLKIAKPIFKKKCLDCHGDGNSKPWYYILLGAKHLMDRDISEAKEHMDMSSDFPFAGHGSPKDDLEALVKTIKEDTMPPWQYKIMHWSSSLNKQEKEILNKWINDSLTLIKGEKK